MITLNIDRRDAGRILVGLRERRRKLEKGVAKFGDDFDPAKGASMLEGLQAYTALIHLVQEAVSNEQETDDHPRSAAGNRAEP